MIIPWKVIWKGAGLTALLFTIGKTAIGLYIGNSAVSNSYGAASSLVVILLWVYYTAQIVFFGAEFIKIDAKSRNIVINPSRFGELVVQKASKGEKNVVVPANKKHAATLLLGYAVKGAVKEVKKEVRKKSISRKKEQK